MSEAPRAHSSRQLFSNHFLENRLRDDELWQEVASEADETREELRSLLEEQRRTLDGANEPQTEERWVKPVLRELGWGYEVQPASKRHGSTQFPDYALFLSQDAADEAAALRERRRILKRGAAVLEAKRWQRDLDAGDPTEDINRVPSTQIINYLIRAEQPWGVLTNGEEWRLYYRDADFADTSYFAVDLPALLGDEPLALGEPEETIPPEEAFRYFYLFFRPEAFRVETEQKRWLDLALDRSVRYAEEVEEALKPRAYRAVEALCRGFVAAHEISPEDVARDDELAETLLDNSLTLLFRLLFLLYAEARDLLPVRTNRAYRRKSLLGLRERAAEQRDEGEELFPRGRDYWSDLHDLFRIVDGDPEWRQVGIPIYNGGLFDPEKHPWLEEHYVADPQLAEALDLLSRTEDPETGELHYVDYGPLDVRNLGSIYEGLLEHRIRVAEEDLPSLEEDDQEAPDTVSDQELYLANEEGERKTTGSYYTPDYVVEYIVEESLGPLVEGRQPAEILELNVLDPAMGSGHFLVEATSYLAREAVRSVEEQDQQLLGDFAELDPEQLRRLVVERCVFGVDKNPRAVELAKLSLWIATVQKGKPLNFLDHHLKCGDSLIGAGIGDLGGLPGRGSDEAELEAAGQFNAFELAFRDELEEVLDRVHSIEQESSERLEQVQKKEDLYRDAEARLERFRAVADLWCSALLGNEALFDEDDRGKKRHGDRYARAVQGLQAERDDWKEVVSEDWFEEALQLGEKHRFFHWEIEFSEVFYDQDGDERDRPGFDAVLGNPPYVRMEELKGLKGFLREIYQTHATRTDLYVYFMERSVDLLRQGGEYGVIVSNKFLRAGYGATLRELLGSEVGVREIVDFGELPVFPDASTMPAVFIGRRGGSIGDPVYAQMPTLEFSSLAREVERQSYEFNPTGLEGAEWRLVPRDVDRVMETVEREGKSLGKVVEDQLLRGIVTGRNAAFFIDNERRRELIEEDSRSEEVIKPLVVGSEIQPYRLERAEHWLLYLPHGVDIEQYPAVEDHLEDYRSKLESRATEQAWYELQQPQEAYLEFFDGPKILYPEIARDARFAFHPGPLYPNNKCFFIPGDDHSLVALLNSRLVYFYLAQVCSTLGDPSEGGRLEFREQYMKTLPVWRPTRSDVDGTTTSVMEDWLGALYRDGLQRWGIGPGDDDRKSPKELAGEVASALERPLVPPRDEHSPTPSADNPFPSVLRQVDEWLGRSTSEAESAVNEFLGRLAKRMSLLHEARLEEKEKFLSWLDGQLDCSIDDLSGKTFVRAYEEQGEGVAKLLEVLDDKNSSSKTGLDVSKPEEYGAENPERKRIISGFERSMDTLSPLLKQIDLTDRLIDQVVYRLYGLTDDEIQVVEEYVG